MHILHFASTALTLDTFVRKISRSLENRGYTFDYVSDLGSVTEETSSNLPKFRLRRGLLFFLSWFGNGRAFQSLLATGPSIVHVHTPATALALWPFLIVMGRRNIKLVYTARGGLNEGVAWPLRMIWALLDPMSWKLWNAVGVINASLLSKAVALRPPSTVHLLSHGGASPNLSTGRPSDVTSHPGSDRKSDKIVLGWVGRFAHDKRPKDFLELVNSLRSDDSLQVEGLMMGDQSQHDRAVEATSIPGISFTGWVECPQDYLRNCDLLISTSVREGYGMAVLEAGLVGTPTIARMTLGTAESVRDSGGYLIESRSVSALVDQVRAWSALSRQEKASLRDKVHKKSLKTLTDGNLADELHAMYKGLTP
jgi:glycosyltransferase involved in cell wall biosynthesis